MLSGLTAYEEDQLLGIRKEAIHLSFVKRCTRCVMINMTDNMAETATLSSLLLKRLAQEQSGTVKVGQNATCNQTTLLSLGDEFSVD